MSKAAIIDTLQAHREELAAAGIVHLALFGSAARDEDTEQSDIDLIAAFDPERRLSLLDVVHLENRLSDLLGRRVDLIEQGTLRPRARASAERDLIRAF